MSTLPQDLTAESLFAWQEAEEAKLERVLLGHTEGALSAILDQAMSFSLTAASARHLWEEAVSRSLADMGMVDDRLLSEDLLEAAIGDEAFNTANKVMSLRSGQFNPVSADELREALTEALELSTPSLAASGENIGEFNWVEKVGGLPHYIREIADELRKKGMTQSAAIATAVNTVKRWARADSAAKGGKGHVSAKTVAKAIAALVEWEAKKAASHVTALERRETLVAAGGWVANVLDPARKIGMAWKNRVKRQVRTGFTGVTGRLTLTEMRFRGIQTKTWVTKHDVRVRHSHVEADGQTVPIGQPFRVGLAELQHPGEHGKPLAEIANCRCILVPGVR